MKKTFIFILLVALLFTACGPKTEKVASDKKTVTVTTSFLYDMVKVIAGDSVERVLIIPAGEDPHLYLMKPEDSKKLERADLVLYHGLYFEGKMNEALEAVGVPVTKDFTDQEIGTIDGDETELDPHFWFDISLYKKATITACEELKKLVPEKADEYQKNCDNYLDELDKLDAYNRERLDEIPVESRYIVTPHDAFNYMSRHYNIPVIAPQGVSTETEVGVKDMDETANFIYEHKIKAIFAESTTDPKRMEALRASVLKKGFDVLVVKGEGNELFSDSLAVEGQKGDNYIDMYKHNIDLIVNNLK